MLKQFIRMILEAEENKSAEIDEINNLFEQIVNKFDLHHGKTAFVGVIPQAIRNNEAFISRYKNSKFRLYINKCFIFSTHHDNDNQLDLHFINAKAVNECIDNALKSLDVFVSFNNYYENDYYAISKEKLRMCLVASKKYDEFEILVKKVMKLIQDLK